MKLSPAQFELLSALGKSGRYAVRNSTYRTKGKLFGPPTAFNPDLIYGAYICDCVYATLQALFRLGYLERNEDTRGSAWPARYTVSFEGRTYLEQRRGCA